MSDLCVLCARHGKTTRLDSHAQHLGYAPQWEPLADPPSTEDDECPF